VAKEQLPLALTNVVRFAHDGKPCSAEPCEATMWSFDLAYPSSSCTPEVVGWIQPSVAKLLPDGTLVLLKGAAVQGGTDVRRPPLLATVENAAEALQFVSVFSAGTDSSIEVLLLSKYQSVSSGFSNVDPSPSSAEVRQLQSSNSSDEDDDNETTTVTTTTAATTTTTSVTNVTNVTNVTSPNVTTTTTSADVSALNETVSAELGGAHCWSVWTPAFFCFALALLLD